MALVDLRPSDRALLEHLVGHTAQATELRRALALLWLDDGDAPTKWPTACASTAKPSTTAIASASQYD
jgi:hypothetical protein